MGYCYQHNVHAVKTTQNVMADSDFLYARNVSTFMQTTKPWRHTYQLHFVSRKCHYLTTVHPLMGKYSIHEFSSVLFGALKHAIQWPLLNCKREAHAPSNKACKWHCDTCFQHWIPLTAWIHKHTHTTIWRTMTDQQLTASLSMVHADGNRSYINVFRTVNLFQATTDKYDQQWTHEPPPPTARLGTQRPYSEFQT